MTMRWQKGVVLGLMAGWLASCTAIHPPAPYLPQKSGIIPGETITVQGNQNVYAVARAHNVSMRDLIVLNNLQPPFVLKPGMSLTLPAGGSMPTAPGGEPVSGGAAPLPSSAASGSVESVELAPPPAAPPSAAKSPVEALNAPSAPPKPVATTVAPASLSPPTASNPPPVQTAMAAPTPPPKPPQTASSAPAPAAAAVPPPTLPPTVAKPSFVWPVQGPIVSSFGPKGQGLNNDGINIGAPKGAPVVAAANGIVVYAGNEMKGFGNLVLIRHEGGWVTAYAHLDRMLVTKDAVVAQGDMIGTVGKSGNVPSPQLHFEVRYDSKPMDPSGVIK
jgi:murein DD-endopeptidase MepM/ murein hydrolase activator NlpD